MKKLLLLAALVVGTSPVWALSYEIGSGSVAANNTDPGLVANTSVLGSVAGLDFSLNDGESFTFDFFKIWTNETDVGWDDTKKKYITATLNFLTPSVNAVGSGKTNGVTELVWVLIFPVVYHSGVLTWGVIDPIIASDRVFSVSLSNEVFNKGLYGLDEGPCNGAIVQATVTQLSHVPDGGMTVALFGAALLGLVAVRRRIA